MPTLWDNVNVRLGLTTRNVWDPTSPRRETWYRWMNDFAIWYAAAGRGWIRNARSGRITLKPGVCLCLAPGWDYDAEQDTRDPLIIYSLHFALCDAATDKLLPFDHSIVPEVLHVPDPACTGADSAKGSSTSRSGSTPRGRTRTPTGSRSPAVFLRRS